MGLISHLKCWCKNVYSPDDDILAIYYVLGQVHKHKHSFLLLSSFAWFIWFLPKILSSVVREKPSKNFPAETFFSCVIDKYL